jgi:mono/diheme cytochrome c family protein
MSRSFRPRMLLSIVAVAAIVYSASRSSASSPIEEQFKYGSIGAEDQEGIPYWIWQALPTLFADKLPPGGYGALGMIWEPGHDVPIGFSKKSVWGVERVAVNCAFCHTASVRTSPTAAPRIVLAGPSHQFDPQAYSRFLDATASDPRFNASDMLAAIGKMTRLSWLDSTMYRLVLIPAVRRGLQKHKEKLAWMDSRPVWGRGRIDPQNPFKFTTLEQPIDATIGNSDMPPLWNMKARRGMALHWDGMTTVYRESLLSSGLGNGATVKSIDVDAIDRLGAWFDDLPPPKYPFPIDAALAAQGRTVFSHACASCHAPGGARTGQVIPIAEVGTDRHRLDTWTVASAAAFNALTKDQPWAFTHFRKTDGMVASLLDGIWLRAPYLHNGSVPSLTDLLEPSAQRPTRFYRGYDVYDPERVGFVSSGQQAEQRGSVYDVSQPGNSNAGHAYGTGLAADEKRALVEFLKTQ